MSSPPAWLNSVPSELAAASGARNAGVTRPTQPANSSTVRTATTSGDFVPLPSTLSCRQIGSTRRRVDTPGCRTSGLPSQS